MFCTLSRCTGKDPSQVLRSSWNLTRNHIPPKHISPSNDYQSVIGEGEGILGVMVMIDLTLADKAATGFSRPC